MPVSRSPFTIPSLSSNRLRLFWPVARHTGGANSQMRASRTVARISNRVTLPVVTTLVALACVSAFSPAAYASAPGPDASSPVPASTAPAIPGVGGYVQRSPEFVAKKDAFQVYSGFRANSVTGSVKGTKQLRPYVLSTGSTTVAYSAPASYELPTNNPVPGSWEPANGCNPNYGPNTAQTDESSPAYNYCVHTQNYSGTYSTTGDKDFFNLCGPGAADNALWYWPKPNNSLSLNWAMDTAPMSPAIATTWSSERMRAYMSYLAWQIHWPSGGLSHDGMMGDTTYPSYGTTMYGIQDALNWEETGETTLSGFYLIQWWNQSSQSNLNQDVVFDTYNNGVPIVAEVDASYLPNWAGAGRGLHHFITIIGYNNSSGIYYYTDTCGHSTTCNPHSSGTDGGVHTVAQSTMWTAISAIPVNTSTAESAGDGGWVW